MARRRHRVCRIGLISDTHGLLRPEAVAALEGVDHIIHAGDIGHAAVLDALAAIASVTAVRGNNDVDSWARGLPLTTLVRECDVAIYVVHEIAHLKLHPAPEEAVAVISGHSHRPSVKTENGVLFVNPGSAGRRRFKLPVSVATLQIDRGQLTARIHELDVAPPNSGR